MDKFNENWADENLCNKELLNFKLLRIHIEVTLYFGYFNFKDLFHFFKFREFKEVMFGEYS